MSIRSKILGEVEQKPRRVKYLKDKIGNNRKVQSTVDDLLKNGTLVQKDGLLFTAASGSQKKNDQALRCTIVKLGPSFGFAQREDGKGDIFIPGRCLMGAMPGDEVLVQLFEHPRVEGSQEGEVLSVTKEHNEFVGIVVQAENGRLALAPGSCPQTLILIKKSADGGVKPGEKAGIVIMERGERHDEHRAGVAIRFGNADRAKMCVKALLYDHGVDHHFPDKVKRAAHRFETAAVTEEEMQGRIDLRGLPIFTIDSADTMDIDDAISLHRVRNGYELGVHIADVSHYVPKDSELDREAFTRGTSIYFPGGVVPMLPRQLSNGICSLNAGEVRLAFSCLMDLDPEGKIRQYRFVKSVIRSRVKGVYSEINAVMDGTADADLYAKYAQVSGQFDDMKALYTARDTLRKQRGGMEIESDESKFELNDQGVCVDVQKRIRGLAERMIEEFMLLANECAAKLAREKNLPLVYRIHEKPDADHVGRLAETLDACGMHTDFAAEVPTQRELAALLDESRGTTLERVVHTGVLRSMSKARYDREPAGHFGLALQDYAHFTSPIRRYPDLAVHRILSAYLTGKTAGELHEEFDVFAKEASEQASCRELEAMQIERDADDFYRAEYMAGHLGEQFEGVVSGITRRMLFVELPNTVEGAVPVESLVRGEPVLREGIRVEDPISGKSWMLGDTVMVTVAAADVATGRVDFAIPAEKK